MLKGKTVLALIPARGGSKRLPGKNIKLLNGQPLIEYVIQTGLSSKIIDELIVSTDSEEIRKIAIKAKANVPFLRPPELAQDDSKTEDVVKHAVLFMEQKNGYLADIIVIIQATSPFTTAEMIDSCISKLENENWDSVITIHEVTTRAEWIGRFSEKGEFKHLLNEKMREELGTGKQYVSAGNVCVVTRGVVFREKYLYGNNTGAIIIPERYAVDIDNELDFSFAEFLAGKYEY